MKISPHPAKDNSDIFREGSRFTSDRLELYWREWLPSHACRGLIVLVHGGAEHLGRYEHVAAFLNRHGYGVAAFDARGHGRSPGKRLFVRSFDEYVRDLDRFINLIAARHPALPLFLLGHSMGGTVATLCVLQNPAPFRGLILSGALLQVGDGFAAWKIRLAKLLGRWIPHLPLDKPNPEHVSRAASVVRRYREDPLVFHGGIPASTGAAALRALDHIEAHCASLDLPLLLLHGTEDRLADIAGSQMLHQRAASIDKTFLRYDGCYHEIFNEPEQEHVLSDVAQWLGRQTTR